MTNWGDEAEARAARERERRSRVQNLQLIGASLFAVFAVCVTIPTCFAHENRVRDERLAAVAASVSAEQAAWNAAHPPVEAGSPSEEPETAASTERLQRRDARRATYHGRSLAQLKVALAAACATGCDPDEVDAIDFNATDAGRAELDVEQKRLEDAEAAREKKREAAEMVTARQRFADDFDHELLAEQMNPNGVTATGSGATTLHVDAWFCTRQWMYNETQEPERQRFESRGFKRIECSSGLEYYWQDLSP